jgi:glycosyltransferase involved in cell wall biosynthesis
MSATGRPRISIVLPTYNGAAYLRQAVESCLAQTWTDWELILVDDASTDTTPALIAELVQRDGRIRSVRNATNRRLPGALNAGFALAQGEYLTWTSDDNLYRPAALAAMVAVLDAQPDVDFVYADYDVIDESGQRLGTNIAMEPVQLIQQYYGVPCFLYRRRVFETLGGYAEDLFLAEDYDYLLRVLLSGYRMAPLHDNLYLYRRHAASLTDLYRGRTFAAAEQALLRNLPRLKGTQRRVRGDAYLYLASLATWRGDLYGARRYTLQAARYAPLRAAGKVAEFALKRLRRGRAETVTVPAAGKP